MSEYNGYKQKNDATVQSRVSRVDLAIIAKYYMSRHDPIMSQSRLVRLIVEDYAAALVKNNLVENITSAEDATIILHRAGIDNLNPLERGKRNYMRNLIQDQIDLGEVEQDYVDNRRTKMKKEKEINDLRRVAEGYIKSGEFQRDLDYEKSKSSQSLDDTPTEDLTREELLKRAEERNKVPDLSKVE